MTLTDQELAELERLHQAATPGPWHVEAEPEDMQSWYICHPATVCAVTTVCQIENEGDAAAIVAAHNALPALIAEIRRLREDGDAVPASTLALIRNDVLEEAARMANGLEISIPLAPGMPDGVSIASKAIAAAIRALKDASLPDYSGGGS